MLNTRPRVNTGLERVFAEPEFRRRLEGRRVAWLANSTTVMPDLVHAVDRSLAEGLDIVRIFGPEHGLRGGAQDMLHVDTDLDPLTGIPTVSLYGATEQSLRPKAADLAGVDVVLIDLQDIGSRYYTYAYTAAYMVEACTNAGVEAWVLDRPNPIGGLEVEGNVVQPEFTSFVGAFPIATRHGMTLGELSKLLAARYGWQDALTVVEMRGWERGMFFDETGLPWVLPSPNMPTLDTALVYPGQCLLEGTNLSEGRGTTRPFELFGAPWVEAQALYDTLGEKAADLPGVAWRTTAFEPTFQKHARKTCCGLQLHVTDRQQFKPLRTAIVLLQALLELFPDDFGWREEVYEFVADRLAIDLLLGDQIVRLAIEDQMPIGELEVLLNGSRAQFDAERAQHLLYA